MTMRLPDGTVLNAQERGLDYERVAPDQRVSGDPMIGVLPLGMVGGVDIGIWELTEGAMRDVEVDEVFIVLAGRADVVIDGEAPGDEPTILHLEPGTLGRLRNGMRSIWTVHEPLRKFYVLGGPPSGTFLPVHATERSETR